MYSDNENNNNFVKINISRRIQKESFRNIAGGNQREILRNPHNKTHRGNQKKLPRLFPQHINTIGNTAKSQFPNNTATPAVTEIRLQTKDIQSIFLHFFLHFFFAH